MQTFRIYCTNPDGRLRLIFHGASAGGKPHKFISRYRSEQEQPCALGAQDISGLSTRHKTIHERCDHSLVEPNAFEIRLSYTVYLLN